MLVGHLLSRIDARFRQAISSFDCTDTGCPAATTGLHDWYAVCNTKTLCSSFSYRSLRDFNIQAGCTINLHHRTCRGGMDTSLPSLLQKWLYDDEYDDDITPTWDKSTALLAFFCTLLGSSSRAVIGLAFPAATNRHPTIKNLILAATTAAACSPASSTAAASKFKSAFTAALKKTREWTGDQDEDDVFNEDESPRAHFVELALQAIGCGTHDALGKLFDVGLLAGTNLLHTTPVGRSERAGSKVLHYITPVENDAFQGKSTGELLHHLRQVGGNPFNGPPSDLTIVDVSLYPSHTDRPCANLILPSLLLCRDHYLNQSLSSAGYHVLVAAFGDNGDALLLNETLQKYHMFRVCQNEDETEHQVLLQPRVLIDELADKPLQIYKRVAANDPLVDVLIELTKRHSMLEEELSDEVHRAQSRHTLGSARAEAAKAKRTFENTDTSMLECTRHEVLQAHYNALAVATHLHLTNTDGIERAEDQIWATNPDDTHVQTARSNANMATHTDISLKLLRNILNESGKFMPFFPGQSKLINPHKTSETEQRPIETLEPTHSAETRVVDGVVLLNKPEDEARKKLTNNGTDIDWLHVRIPKERVVSTLQDLNTVCGGFYNPGVAAHKFGGCVFEKKRNARARVDHVHVQLSSGVSWTMEMVLTNLHISKFKPLLQKLTERDVHFMPIATSIEDLVRLRKFERVVRLACSETIMLENLVFALNEIDLNEGCGLSIYFKGKRAPYDDDKVREYVSLLLKAHDRKFAIEFSASANLLLPGMPVKCRSVMTPIGQLAFARRNRGTNVGGDNDVPEHAVDEDDVDGDDEPFGGGGDDDIFADAEYGRFSFFDNTIDGQEGEEDVGRERRHRELKTVVAAKDVKGALAGNCVGGSRGRLTEFCDRGGGYVAGQGMRAMGYCFMATNTATNPTVGGIPGLKITKGTSYAVHPTHDSKNGKMFQLEDQCHMENDPDNSRSVEAAWAQVEADVEYVSAREELNASKPHNLYQERNEANFVIEPFTNTMDEVCDAGTLDAVNVWSVAEALVTGFSLVQAVYDDGEIFYACVPASKYYSSFLAALMFLRDEVLPVVKKFHSRTSIVTTIRERASFVYCFKALRAMVWNVWGNLFIKRFENGVGVGLIDMRTACGRLVEGFKRRTKDNGNMQRMRISSEIMDGIVCRIDADSLYPSRRPRFYWKQQTNSNNFYVGYAGEGQNNNWPRIAKLEKKPVGNVGSRAAKEDHIRCIVRTMVEEYDGSSGVTFLDVEHWTVDEFFEDLVRLGFARLTKNGSGKTGGGGGDGSGGEDEDGGDGDGGDSDGGGASERASRVGAGAGAGGARAGGARAGGAGAGARAVATAGAGSRGAESRGAGSRGARSAARAGSGGAGTGGAGAVADKRAGAGSKRQREANANASRKK